MADKYGIPAGGDPYPGKVKYYKNDKKTLPSAFIEIAVKEAGWPENLRETAVQIAKAESGGAPNIYNTYKQGHFGLFQISRSAWPDLFALGSDRWTDPVTNAKYAYKIYKIQGFKAWEAYTNGKYKGAKVDESVLEPGTGVGAVDDALGLGTINEVLSGLYESLTTPAFWMRVGYGAAGIILIAGGLFLIAKNGPVGSAVKTVAKVTPVGRAATVAKSAAQKG